MKIKAKPLGIYLLALTLFAGCAQTKDREFFFDKMFWRNVDGVVDTTLYPNFSHVIKGDSLILTISEGVRSIRTTAHPQYDDVYFCLPVDIKAGDKFALQPFKQKNRKSITGINKYKYKWVNYLMRPGDICCGGTKSRVCLVLDKNEPFIFEVTILKVDRNLISADINIAYSTIEYPMGDSRDNLLKSKAKWQGKFDFVRVTLADRIH